MKNNNYSPLRYPGGKSRLIDFMKSIIEQNNLKGGTYIEPFSGGAAIALALAIDGYMKRVVINDYDRSIYAFWHSILYYTDAFIDKIRNTPLSIDEWYTQRQIQQNKQNVDLFDLGFSTFFLNRTNRSGVLKAGVIGGLQNFDIQLIITGSGPGTTNGVNVPGYYIFQLAWSGEYDVRYGYASAIGVIIFIITIGFSIANFRKNKKEVA